MRTVWFLRGGDVLASGEVAESIADRARGLMGLEQYEGALLLMRTRSVHTAGMRFPLDVAYLDKELHVVATTTLRTWSVALPRRGAAHILEARAGAFERWRLRPGDQLEIRETP
ncbi:MAG: DUF192 domain-containing protein [Actinomycetota bacterium]|jgi:uncharacterized membrane protein (UPF0127 family)|nr:DUF192 domain-containing protein [Actinomycetota bacterium]